MKRISAGVITCNEERTIGPLLERLAAAPDITEIIVVSAECRDETDGIVRRHAAADPRIRLIAEPKRRGKSAAVNTFLAARGASDLTLLTSGDVLPAPDFVARVAGAFDDPATGMAGGRPVPVNGGASFTGRMAGLMWHLHHEIAREHPKLGETVMFRSGAVSAIPDDSPVDEASIEALVLAAGLRLAYVPGAIVSNRGPDTFAEWLSQRRRIAYGHAWLEKSAAHHVSTGSPSRVFPLLASHLARHPADLPVAVALMVSEALARVMARRDLRGGNRHQVWEIARSTKTLSS